MSLTATMEAPKLTPPTVNVKGLFSSNAKGSALDMLQMRTIGAHSAPKTDPAFASLAKSNAQLASVAIKAAEANRQQRFADIRRADIANMYSRRDNEKVIDLLDKIRDALLRMRSGDGLLGGALDVLGLGSRAGIARRGRGRYRDERGRFTKRPDTMSERLRRRLGFGAREGAAAEMVGGARVAKNVGAFGKVGGALGAAGHIAGKLAIPVMAAFAIADAAQGVANADKILGKRATNGDKIGVAVTEALNGVLLGIPDWISENVFGVSFSRGMNNVARKATSSITDVVSKSVSAVAKFFADPIMQGVAYVKLLTRDVTDLVDAIKERRWKDLPGLLKKLVKDSPAGVAVQVAYSAAKVAAPVVANAAANAGSYTLEAGRKVAQAIGSGLGAVSARFESRGGAGTVSSGKGDKGGVSYGKYQLASKNGSVSKFLKASGYDKQFAGLKPGSKEFGDRWRSIAKSDPNFEKAQHDYIVDTHYAPQLARLKRKGIDLSGRGRAVQEAIFSTSVQHGASTSVIEKALKDKPVAKMTDAQIVAAIQDYKANNVESHFKSSSADQRRGVAKRIAQEKALLLSLASEQQPVTNSRPAANVSAPLTSAATATPTSTISSPAMVTSTVNAAPTAQRVAIASSPSIPMQPLPRASAPSSVSGARNSTPNTNTVAAALPPPPPVPATPTTPTSPAHVPTSPAKLPVMAAKPPEPRNVSGGAIPPVSSVPIQPPLEQLALASLIMG